VSASTTAPSGSISSGSIPVAADTAATTARLGGGGGRVPVVLEAGHLGLPAGCYLFQRIMVKRTLVSAPVIGAVGFGTFLWLLDQCLSEAAARNHLLLLVVLFEVVNIGNARSETTSLFRLSPLGSPILLAGTAAAFLVHLGSMYFPPAQAVLGTTPAGLEQWLLPGAVALTIAVAVELHKLSWKMRYPPRSGTEGTPSSTQETGR
jgi:hypothetical protein